jgi:hypothetical protein
LRADGQLYGAANKMHAVHFPQVHNEFAIKAQKPVKRISGGPSARAAEGMLRAMAGLGIREKVPMIGTFYAVFSNDWNFF